MTAALSLFPFALMASAVMAVLLAAAVRRRCLSAPGVAAFTWLMIAVAGWAGTSAAHAFTPSLDVKLLWAKAQYLAISSVAPLWLLFAVEYAGAGWFARRADGRSRLAPARLLLLWAIPVLTMVMAATNEWHRALWPQVRLDLAGYAIYEHGWWFWLAMTYNYVLVFSGSVLLARTLRQSPALFRGQAVVLITAALLPWSGNVLYVSGLVGHGVDVTPLAFTLSGLMFVWAFYRNHLFDLVPVARDMVVDSLSDAMFVLDPSRRVLDMNAAARRLVGEIDWIGRSVDEALPPLRRVTLEATAGTAMTVGLSTTGEPRDFDVRVMAVSTRSGRFAAWAVLLCDVTEERLAAAEREAFQVRAQEQQRRESLSILAGGIAHDFNNLLACIVGNADLLAMQVPHHRDTNSSIGAILLGAQRAAGLVSKMLAYAGERHGSIERVDLDRLVRELLDLLRASAGRHCRIEYEGEPASIVGDPTQLRQVAMNLIINAAEAVDEGTGAVSITVGTATLAARQFTGMTVGADAAPGRYAFLEVRDNGSGMDDETLRRIFNPFFTTKPSGHGLGLAAVQGIVIGHRGAMRVETKPGFGSRFCVWFPREGQASAALRRKHAS